MRTLVVDSHRHFTGTLPAWFICAEARNRRTEPQVAQAVLKLVGDHVLTPDGFREACKRALVRETPAYKPFFELYELVQAITKPRDSNCEDFYYRAGRAIAAQIRRERTSVCLIMGMHPDIDILERRVRNTILGAATLCRSVTSIQVRVTFIRSSDGSFKNLSPSLIDALFALVDRHSELEGYIEGIDFCGVEFPHEPQPIFDALEQIRTHNNYRASRSRRRLEVSVHAGEDLVCSSLAAQLTFLEELCTRSCGPQAIAHGTLLWIRAEDAGLDSEQQRRREACLQAMATKGIALEICPTANLRMTPLSRRRYIPVGKLVRAGVRVKLGSDNPVLLGTTIRREVLATMERRQ